MGTHSAGNVSGGNNGKTEDGRGVTIKFSYTKSGRKTGRVPAGISSAPNSNRPDDTKTTVKDPRLT